ncbi:hypothetical protein B0H63DRAFT_511458 [Podospora didyma]|uniref:Uncharacterized protein n=1 Tax=Podospora didyma TaxID=330526 RepID=A0AAE0TW90_9PEZI|nr:hypothetical protein B0H63DRAFT_511458 [Podospora didyma]
MSTVSTSEDSAGASSDFSIRSIGRQNEKQAFAYVVDWQARDGEKSTWRSEPRIFHDSQALDSFLAKPCEVHTFFRIVLGCSHTNNARKLPHVGIGQDSFLSIEGRLNPSFRTHVVHSSFLKASNLGCYVWNVQFSGVDDRAKYTGCSIDYLAECPVKNTVGGGTACAASQHSFSLTSSGGDSSGAVKKKSRACPRRISIAIRHGRLPLDVAGEDWVYEPKDPRLVLMIAENSPHDETQFDKIQLHLMLPVIGYRLSIGEGPIAYQITQQCLKSIFSSLGEQWFQVTELAVAHTRNLEDGVYSRPDDSSPSGELWRASKNWLTLERLSRAHSESIKQFKHQINKALASIIENPSTESPVAGPSRVTQSDSDLQPIEFESVLEVLQRCNIKAQDDLITPTNSLLDMLYKSVAIRDARLSLELNASLWRLSWITFIFLPLTFLSGFFGMNVDLFSDNPSIKWYFIAAAVVAVLSFLVWVGFKLAEKKRVHGLMLVLAIVAEMEKFLVLEAPTVSSPTASIL